MNLFYETPDGRAKLYLGDAIEVMASFPDACVDAIVTDPPYGLEFMGKEWDSPNRYAKPGESSGGFFNYSGHARMGQKLYTTDMQAYQSWITAWATEAYRILKPGAYMLVMGGTRTHHRLGCGLEDAGFEIRDELAWVYASGFPKNYDVSKGMDKRAGAKREIVGRKYSEGAYQVGGFGQSPRDYGKDVEGFVAGEQMLTQPATPEAQYWEGYGTALKPAHEPIWLCKKPNEGTYVDNVLKHGCGAMNIDGCRISGTWERTTPRKQIIRGGKFHAASGMPNEPWPPQESHQQGRWPANVLVDCYPEEFIGGVVIEGEGKGQQAPIAGHRSKGLVGGWAEWEGADPRAGTLYTENDDLGNGLLGPYTRFFVIPKPSKSEKTCGGKVENKHVTVKPVRLGMWLIKLITPHQHPVIVADLFCGSGSFLVSGLRLNQEQGYQIEMWGIDKDKDSVETARERLKAERTLQGVLL